MLLFRKIQKAFRAILLPLLKLWPMRIDPSLIVIEGPWGLLDDNSGALLRAMVRLGVNDRFRIVYWVSDRRQYLWFSEPGVELIDMRTLGSFVRLIRLLCRAKFYLFSNVTSPSGKPRPGQCHLYLSHGIPLKRYAGFKHHADTSIPFLSLSDFASGFWQRSNGLPPDRFLPLGFPRNDLLFKRGDALERLGLKRPDCRGVVVWMPTFRQRKRERLFNDPNAADAIPLFNTPEKWNGLVEFCTRNKLLLILKLHSAQALAELPSTEEEGWVRILTTEGDLVPSRVCNYELLAQADALITDYSSVAFDFLLTDKPIGYVVDDINAYREKPGFAIDDPLSVMPGPHIRTDGEFIAFLSAFRNDPCAAERRVLRARMHAHSDPYSSERLVKHLGLLD